jgi:predicted XRE-type DNA-binding protein
MAAPSHRISKNPEEGTIHASSGNVFADLDLPEAQELRVKAELAHCIGSILRHRHLTQIEAAESLGVDQPKISALLRGRLAGFSTDRLLRCLTTLDRDMEIVIKKNPRTREHASLRVVSV